MYRKPLNLRFRIPTWNYFSLFCFIVFFFGISDVFSQDRKKLEEQRFKIIEQIEITEGFLNKTVKERKSTLDDFEAIQSQINYRQSLIDLVEVEGKTIAEELEINRQNLDSLHNRMELLSNKYNHLLRWAYVQQRSKNNWASILSSESLNEAFIKWRFFSQFKSYINRQAAQLKLVQAQVEQENKNIQTARDEKAKLLESEITHFNLLQDELSIKNDILSELNQNEEKLQAELKEKKKQRENLNKAIERVILAEIEARRKANKTREENLAATPESKALSNNFLENKGRLPWPVEKGFITQRFGKQTHPSLKNISIENNGIDIRSENQSLVRSVFEGEVVGVMSVPGHDNMVIIRHGEYYSVYSKLSEVYVQKSEFVITKQPIGIISENENNNAIMHLEIWKGKTKINPALWLAKK